MCRASWAAATSSTASWAAPFRCTNTKFSASTEWTAHAARGGWPAWPGLGWAFYEHRRQAAGQSGRWAHSVCRRCTWTGLYTAVVGNGSKVISRGLDTVDNGVDGAMNGVVSNVGAPGWLVTIWQSGFVRAYALSMLLGTALIVGLLGTQADRRRPVIHFFHLFAVLASLLIFLVPVRWREEFAGAAAGADPGGRAVVVVGGRLIRVQHQLDSGAGRHLQRADGRREPAARPHHRLHDPDRHHLRRETHSQPRHHALTDPDDGNRAAGHLRRPRPGAVLRVLRGRPDSGAADAGHLRQDAPDGGPDQVRGLHPLRQLADADLDHCA